MAQITIYAFCIVAVVVVATEIVYTSSISQVVNKVNVHNTFKFEEQQKRHSSIVTFRPLVLIVFY